MNEVCRCVREEVPHLVLVYSVASGCNVAVKYKEMQTEAFPLRVAMKLKKDNKTR